ncbi:MAG: SDR family NAD(P)-dependent oxidoreductase [Verrucomicrobiota bacterium]
MAQWKWEKITFVGVYLQRAPVIEKRIAVRNSSEMASTINRHFLGDRPSICLLTSSFITLIVNLFEMDVAIVTGADSRFGDAACRTLLKMGFRIHALGQNPNPSAYDERYYIAHPCGPGKLSELKNALDEIVKTETRIDLLVGLGGAELVAGWEKLSPEQLVRRISACLTEPMLAASICLPALIQSKGFLIQAHRRPVNKDLVVAAGYCEDLVRRAYDDLFSQNAVHGLRTARILFAVPDEDVAGDDDTYQIADAVSGAFETILRQKETCVLRELDITPRGVGPVTKLPNLISRVDPYQTTVLSVEEESEKDLILIPTEKPRHYVQIAEVKDITDGEGENDERYPEEEIAEYSESISQKKTSSKKAKRRRRPSRTRTKNKETLAERPGEEKTPTERSSDSFSPEKAAEATTVVDDQKAKKKTRKQTTKKVARKKPTRARKVAKPEADTKETSDPPS